MKKPSLRLWLYERKFFFAGEELRGLCRMSPIRIIDIVRPIHIRLKGVITATSPDNSATFERECLRMSVYLDAETGYEKRQDVYYYDFNFQLPYNLPPTINHPIADTTITYTLKVELEIQHGLRTTETLQTELDIDIRKIIHVHDPQYLVPLERSFESPANGCCFASGTYSVDARIDRTGFTTDEPVIISVKFENHTNRRANPYITLVQKARNPYCLDFEEFEFPLTTGDQTSKIPARSEGQWTNIVVRIPPECTESFSYPFEQPFFKVFYFIEIGLQGAFGKGGTRLPIEIGTVPFHRSTVASPIGTSPKVGAWLASSTTNNPNPNGNTNHRTSTRGSVLSIPGPSKSAPDTLLATSNKLATVSTRYIRAERRQRRFNSIDSYEL